MLNAAAVALQQSPGPHLTMYEGYTTFSILVTLSQASSICSVQ